MKPDISLFSLKKNYDAAIAGLIGAILIFIFARHGGIGLSPDSIVYVSTAREIVSHGAFAEFEDLPVTDFPLGYPTFLSIILFITRIDLLQSGVFINMFLYFCLIYLCGGIINHISTKNKWIKIPFLFLIVFSPALLNVFTFLWSETLFLVMILLFFIALHLYGKEKTILTLILVALIAGLSCVVRYAGVTLVGAGGLMILLDRKLLIGKKIGHLLLFGTIGVMFLVGNLFRNYLITGMLTGDREKSLTSLFKNIENYAYVFSNFFYFKSFPIFFVLLIGVSFFIFYIYSHIIHILKTNRYYNYWNICAVFFIVYSLFMILSATFSRYETLNERLLSPLYLPCLLPLTFVVTWLIAKVKGWRKYTFISFFGLLFVIINIFQFKDNYELYDMAKDGGIPGYAEDCWKNSPIMEYIKKNPAKFKPDTRIYSDGPEAIYLFTGFPADLIPHKESKADNTNFKEDQQIEYYVVWFYDNANPELITLAKILKENKLFQLVSYPEGCIFYHPAPPDKETTIKKK